MTDTTLDDLDRAAAEAARTAAAAQAARDDERHRIDQERAQRDRDFRARRLASYDRVSARDEATARQFAFYAAVEADPVYAAAIDWYAEKLWEGHLAQQANDDASWLGQPQPFPMGLDTNRDLRPPQFFPAGAGGLWAARDQANNLPAIPAGADGGVIEAVIVSLARARFEARRALEDAALDEYVNNGGPAPTAAEQARREADERETQRRELAATINAAPSIPAAGLTEAARAELGLPPGGERTAAQRRFEEPDFD